MNLQEQPYTKPQPIRVSLDAPAEQLYGLANNLRTDESARKAFERSPQEIMREFGLQTSAIRWDLAPKHEKGGDKGHGGKKHGESEAEVVIACIGAASDVVVGVLVCVGLACAPSDPIEEV